MTMYDYRTNLSNEVYSEVKNFFKDKVYKSTITSKSRLPEAPSFGLPIMLYDEKCKGADAYKALTREFLDRQQKGDIMSKKFGLGKGLNALIPEEVSNNINSKKEKNKDGVALIDINLIKNNNNYK